MTALLLIVLPVAVAYALVMVGTSRGTRAAKHRHRAEQARDIADSKKKGRSK